MRRYLAKVKVVAGVLTKCLCVDGRFAGHEKVPGQRQSASCGWGCVDMMFICGWVAGHEKVAGQSESCGWDCVGLQAMRKYVAKVKVVAGELT